MERRRTVPGLESRAGVDPFQRVRGLLASHRGCREGANTPGRNGIFRLSNFRPHRHGHYGRGAYWWCRSSSKECCTTDKFHRRVLEGGFWLSWVLSSVAAVKRKQLSEVVPGVMEAFSQRGVTAWGPPGWFTPSDTSRTALPVRCRHAGKHQDWPSPTWDRSDSLKNLVSNTWNHSERTTLSRTRRSTTRRKRGWSTSPDRIVRPRRVANMFSRRIGPVRG